MANFRAKARAVELLGKGQIADLPTAITELWKNGYDAYAKNLECKLFLDTYKDNISPIFLLSDDGFGMSEEDILNKWFVLGTDSKARNEKITPEFGLQRRIPMGEKGIGRLSVSYLGSQMLMITKKKNKKASAFFIDWRVLDNYDFFLEDLNIPLFSFGKVEDFEKSIDDARNMFKENLNKDKWKEQLELRDAILKNLEEIHLPKFIYNDVIDDFCKKDYHGTCFIVFTPHDQLLELSDKDRVNLLNDSSLKYLRASLSGLHNDLKTPNKDFNTKFLIYDAAGKYDLIDDFFTKDEMLGADHWLKGEFDEHGLFSGEIKIFDRREKYTFKPNRPPGLTPYGPFSIEWGAVEGELKSSTLTKEEYANLNSKLETFGGLYIYRDDFRVLPYGRTESDFLEFEKRRSMRAGEYFFSHRRFIGYIDLSREYNKSLKDKAGREGFIQNKAYREFRQDLIDFFIDIAKRYLRSSNNEDERTLRDLQIDEIRSKFEKQLAAAKRKNAKTKKAFVENLKEFQNLIDGLTKEIFEIEKEIQSEVDEIEINYNNYNKLLERFDSKKSDLRALKIQKPKGVKITKRQEQQYTDYQKKYYSINDKVNDIILLVDKTRERINLENLKLEFNEKFRGHIRYIDRQFKSFQEISKDSFKRIYDLLGQEREVQKDSFITQSEPYKISEDDTKENISIKINGLINLIEEQKKVIENSFEGFITHIKNVQIDVDDDFLRGWYQEQNENLEKRLSDYEELAQLGMAIEIIDHQFNVMYSQMNDAVHEIDMFARKNKEIEYSFKQLKNAFQHLEGNYKLLKPLYRTSRRTREVITGHELEKYIKKFFENEFSRYRIEFTVNDAFREYEFFSYDSIVKPVFLNIINNANYWLIPSAERKIRIELINDEIRIMNSGERIDDTQLEDIFTLFYTRKRDGRGIGLYLAKNNLNAIGYEIYATNDSNYNLLQGACFVITKKK
ncbi:ATP-binding protein [uncultured Tenacibaculum sp.]|uniref:ATP-binding protein n=1 Tax=uncultured Tenacibaculum sp. TaxID=174713 RepID=UPI00263373B0|nr:ATP-binding protein [uncultured Tenacibaculum sp.]